MGEPKPFLYTNRRQAGFYLAGKLKDFKNRSDVIVFGLPRGGVPVAYEVAKKLNVAFDILVVRKLGVPGQEELAMGAIAANGSIVFNDDVANGIPESIKQEVIAHEMKELVARERKYRGNRPFPDLHNSTVLLVDDGLATGATMRVAIKAIRPLGPRMIVVGVPVAPQETYESLREIADLLVCAQTPRSFMNVGAWYQDFSQTTDEEVRSLSNSLIKPSQA